MAAIPASDLTIQWDLAGEAGRLEQRRLNAPAPAPVFEIHNGDDLPSMFDSVARLSDRVPDDVELGFHLCDGHGFLQPENASGLRDATNHLVHRIKRPITYFHLPIQVDHGDEPSYYTPFEELEVAPETELNLGLVYPSDGLEGATRRIKAAEQTLSEFGISAECGFTHFQWEDIPAVLDLHRTVAETV